MKARSDTERILDAYLAPEADRLADRVIDAALADIVVPFNERTASRAAVALTRGSRVAVPDSKALRLFLHWCQPKCSSRVALLSSSGRSTIRFVMPSLA